MAIKDKEKDKEIEKKFKEEMVHSLIETNSYTVKEIANTFIKPQYIIPTYQRKERWSDSKKSLLIESLIINLPLPPIFLFEKEEGKYEVVDGQQRLSAIKDFYNSEYKLTKLEKWDDLNGRTYDKLPIIIKEYLDTRILKTINLITDDQGKKSDIQKILFERLNTGGLKLEKQDIRNAVYEGELNKLMIELSTNEKFINMVPISSDAKKKMKDCETILRFFTYLEKKSISAISMDNFMKSNLSIKKKELKRLKEKFNDTLDLIENILDENAFKENSKLILMKYDVYMNVFSSLLERKDEILEKKDEIKTLLSSRQNSIFEEKSTKSQNIKKAIIEVNNLILSLLTSGDTEC